MPLAAGTTRGADEIGGGATCPLSLADGRLSTRAECNPSGGGFTLSGTTLNAGPAFACTRAACPTMAFESACTNLLSGEHTVP